MLVILMMLGQVAYIAQAPLFSRTQKVYEYGYLAIVLLFILLIVLASTKKIAMTDGTLILIGLFVYAPVWIRLLKKTESTRSSLK